MKTFFLIAEAILLLTLTLLSIFSLKSKNEYKKFLVIPIGVAIFALISYAAFICSQTIKKAVFFDGLYFISTDWMCFTLLIFTIKYTETKKNMKLITNILFYLTVIDTISLLVNNYTLHSFSLALATYKNTIQYYGASFSFIHYMHLGLCYVMVIMAYVLLILKTKKSASLYKIRYISILFAYAIVIITNMICYSLDLPIDFSLLLYAVLAGFLCYYSIFAVPQQLVVHSLAKINENVSDAIFCYDMQKQHIYTNKSAKHIISSNELSQKYVETWISRYSSPTEKAYIKLQDIVFEIEGVKKTFAVEFHNLNYHNSFIGSFVKLRDITNDIEKLNRQHFLVTHDHLTGALNRESFFAAVKEELQKNPDAKKLMLCSNIKDFRILNEMFGEITGDEVLKKQASIIQQYAHNGTLYGRIGDDKFAMLIDKESFSEEPFMEGIKKMSCIAERSSYQMHIYIGIYEITDISEDPQLMYDKSHMAIENLEDDYQQIFFYYDNAVMEKLLKEKNIVGEFDNALKENQFQMFLQPQMDKNCKLIGAEALVRWFYPGRGFIPPIEFIEVLENTGLIYKLDSYIWEEAAKKLMQWKQMGLDYHISVNVSSKDFYYIDIYKTFTYLVKKYDIDPSKLNIEITETVLMADFVKSMELFNQLQQFGFNIEIDDFGSGYSSLNMLKDIKADVLKIDMMFLRAATDKEQRSRIILNSIIKMAKQLNMTVITEGVETTEQIDFLKQMGCDIFQGYFFSKPISVEDFEKKYFAVS